MPNLKLPTEQTTGSPPLEILAARCITNGYNSWLESRPQTADPLAYRLTALVPTVLTVDQLAYSFPALVPAVLTLPMFPHQETVRASTDRYVSPSKVTFPTDARRFADTHGATEGVEVLCKLAFEMVPAVEHVDVKVICDPEDGESSLHVTVRTLAEADEVVEAEEHLYGALFDRVDPAGCRLLSLGYDFRG